MGNCYGGSLNKLIFRPPPPRREDEYKVILNKYLKIVSYLTNDNKEISAIIGVPKFIPGADKCIIFSHGNNCDAFTMFYYIEKWATDLGAHVVCYDYIGYGLSADDEPSENGCYASLEATIDYVNIMMGINKSKIYLMGQSLGTGVIINYVSKTEWLTPIILISPYKTICRIIIDSCIVTPIDKFKNIQKIKHVHCPVKIIHGTRDTIINIEHAVELYNKLPNKSLDPSWIEDADHNDILDRLDDNIIYDVLCSNNEEDSLQL